MATTSNADGEAQPSAPPPWIAPSPPNYEAAANPSGRAGGYYPASRTDRLAESLQTAGKEIYYWLRQKMCAYCIY